MSADREQGETAFEGTWDVGIATPIGNQAVILEISREGGLIRGTARQGDEVVEFVDPAVEGKRLTWKQTIRKPIHLKLKFDVTVEGDRMTGVAKAGRLPSSKVAGERVA